MRRLDGYKMTMLPKVSRLVKANPSKTFGRIPNGGPKQEVRRHEIWNDKRFGAILEYRLCEKSNT